ncbi:MAG: hypothetical protein J7485_05840 [Sphingobium sp.]|nr:hypothetical protein [Sphingobium sp.]
MEPGLSIAPPPALEKLVWRLLPPMVREEVAGDLWERFRSPLRYLADAASALPFLIVSQARRQTNGPLFLLQAFTIFASFGGFEPSFGAPGLPMSVRALCATIPALATLLLRAAYRPTDDWTGSRAASDLLWTLIAVLGGQLLALLIHPPLAVPTGFFVGGLSFSLAMLLVLRSGLYLVTGTARLDAVEQDYERFNRRIRFKNNIEIGLLLPLLGVAFWFATIAVPIVAAIDLIWIALTLLLILLNIARRPRPMPMTLPPAGKLAFYRGQLARQRHVVGLAWWWYFFPLFGGLGVNLVLRATIAGQRDIALGGIACMTVLAFTIARANRERRRELGAKIAALNRLDQRATD